MVPCWLLQRHCSLKVIPSPSSPTVLFDLFWASLHHLRTDRNADVRDCLLIFSFSFAVMMSSPSLLAFWEPHFHLCACVFIFVCAWEFVSVHVYIFFTVSVHSMCAHESLCIHVFYVGWGFTLQWLRDITAIYWATRDWAHWDFYRAPQHKCANQRLMHYLANTYKQ